MPSKLNPQALAVDLSHFDSLPDCAHVRLPIVRALHGISRTTVWRWVRAGTLPAPKQLGPRTVAWSVGDLRRSILARGAS